jgi:hypothetical protein
MQAEIKIMDTRWDPVNDARFNSIDAAVKEVMFRGGYNQSDDEPLMIGYDDERGVLAFVFQDAVYRIDEENSNKKRGRGNS